MAIGKAIFNSKNDTLWLSEEGWMAGCDISLMVESLVRFFNSAGQSKKTKLQNWWLMNDSYVYKWLIIEIIEMNMLF